MSLVFAPSRGIRANTSPARIFDPSSTDKIASTDIGYVIGAPASLRTGSPSSPTKMISGFKSLPRGAARQSTTIFCVIPVASSVSSRTAIPFTRSTCFAIPSFSAMIGNVYGSHSNSFAPRSIVSPALTNNFEP